MTKAPEKNPGGPGRRAEEGRMPAGVGRHDLEHPRPGLWRCLKCGWEWTYRARTACPDLPRYGEPPRPVLPHLKTKTELKKAGKKPGGPARGAVLRSVSNEYLRLYDEREAEERPRATPAQRRGLARAREAKERKKRTCGRCGTLEDHELYPRTMLCDGCLARDRELAFAQAEEDERARRAERLEHRAAASAWARDVLAAPDALAVFDSETTGLDVAEFVEVAAVDGRGEVLLNARVKPALPIEEGALAVHGISEQDLEEAPTFLEVYPALEAALRGRRVVAYNAAFDWSVLLQAIARRWRCFDTSSPLYQPPPPPSLYRPYGPFPPWDCAMEHWSAFVGEYSEYHQSYRWQRLEGGDHSALGDARATLALLREMAAGDGPSS